jgi:hypothetical protein
LYCSEAGCLCSTSTGTGAGIAALYSQLHFFV